MPRVRLDGGLIGVTNNPSSGSAGGMWSFSEHSKYTRSSGWPSASNPVGSINAQILLVAGGGGGGYGAGGGGGAGGLYYNNNLNIPGTNYTVIIGAGGTGAPSGAYGTNGSNTTITGSVNYTVIGGGAGGTGGFAGVLNGLSGGSGGGGSNFNSVSGTGGSSTQNSTYGYGVGFSGGTGYPTTPFPGGGGGGAANSGANGTSTLAGAGGAGLYYSVSGSNTAYSGGGGGGTNSPGTPGTGGVGGGGAGSVSGSGTSGTNNTGGGGGGDTNATGGNGGSGVAIINYPAPQQFTGGTVTNVNNLAGSNIVHTFTTSGSLNALATPIDTYFPQTTLLLHGDGTVGANNTVFLDSSANTYIPAATGTTYSNYFNGSTAFLTASSSTAFNQDVDFTLEFWFYALALPGSSDAKFWQGPGLAPALSSTGSIVVDDQVTGNVLTSLSAISLNTWYHVAVVRNGPTTNNARLYLNGVIQQTISYSNWQTGTGVTIGKRVDTGTFFNGYISNMRFVRGNAVYTSAFTPPTAPLTAISNTTFLTCQSPRFVDNSTNNLTITQTGNPVISSGGIATIPVGKPTQGTFSPFSQTGWSNYFDGTGDYHTIAQNAAFAFGTGDYTIEAWIWKNDTARQVGIVDTRGANSGGVLFYLTSSGYLSAFDGTSTYIGNSAATLVTPYVWHHVAITRSSGTTTLFIDGISVASISGDTRNNTNGAGGTLIARQFGSTSADFNGYISNVRIIKGTAVYTSNFTPPIAPLTAITNTQLLTCQSNRFIDNSTNAFTLTPSGDASVQPFSPFSPSSAYSNTVVGGSIRFNGSTDYLSSSSNVFGVGSGNFTVEFWAYKNNAWSTGNQFIVDNGATNGMQIWVNTSAGALRLGRYGVDVVLDYAYSSLTPNQWYHMAYVRSGTSVALFVNGTRVATATSSASFLTSSTTQNIGRSTDTTNYWNGYISNLRVINGTAAYDPAQTTITVPTAPLTAVANTTLLLNATNAGIIDNTGKNSFFTAGAATISSSQSKFGGTSIYLDGTSAISAPFVSSWHSFHLSDFTVELWVNPPSYTGMSSTASNITSLIGGMAYNANVNDWSFGMTTSGILKFNYYNGATISVTSSTTIPLNTWSHIAAVKTSSGISLYYNGTLVAGPTAVSGTPSVQAGTFITLGAFNGAYCNAYVDDVRISKYARYTTNFTPPTSAFLDQ